MKLHLGCGENYLAGYRNIDQPPASHTVRHLTETFRLSGLEIAKVRRIRFRDTHNLTVIGRHDGRTLSRAEIEARLLYVWTEAYRRQAERCWAP